MCQSGGAGGGGALSLSAADEAEAKRLFTALSNGGQVRMPNGQDILPGLRHGERPLGVPWMVVDFAA